MSVYGDSTSIRNGRTSSEISIYDYPEHLNPFYEDENHKRIRFWKIGKNKKSNSSSNAPSRRNSFSFGGLKDMWAFKSFRPKKSSTLGINKTSESPPRLQTVDIRDTNYGTLDNKSRYSTGLHNVNDQQFQRNVPYRSSLQDMRYSGGSGGGYQNDVNLRNNNGFGRNEMYRATIQTPSRMNHTNNRQMMMQRNSTNQRYQVTSSPKLQSSDRRYVYGGSVTPQPIRSKLNDKNSDGTILKIYERQSGSSQLSVASSTNPFEDDDDDDNDKENLNTTWHGELNKEHSDKIRPASSANSLTRPYRKKRRAPPPPVPIPNVIEEEPNKKDGNEISPAHINENEIQSTNQKTSQEHVITNEEKEISNLTAEIESFVNQTVKEDSPEQNVPPVPPERKYFREDISSKTQKNKSGSPTPTPTIVITEEKQEVKTTKKPSVTIISEPTVIEQREVIILEDERDSISNEPQKVIVQTTIVEKGGSRTVTVSDTNSSNEKILNTDTKPIASARKINKVHNEAIIQNDINITNNIITPPTSPKKEKPPISPKPNLTDIQNKINEPAQQQQQQTGENNLTSELCKYNHIPINQCELKITESSEDISAEIANEIVSLPYVPLKSDSPINNESVIIKQNDTSNIIKSASQNDINENVELRETKLDNNLINNIRPRSHFTDKEPEHRRPIKYERKKSVREIIESINKNQSLLKVNNTKSSNGANGRESKDFEIKTNNLGESELKDLDESQRDFKKLLFELENYECNNNKNQKNLSEINNNHIAEIDLIFNKIDQLNENENVFKKCTATHHINGNSITTTTTTTVTTSSKSSREASPTASNLDWNPVPKPKRTKKLNNDLIMTTSSSPDSCNERLVE